MSKRQADEVYAEKLELVYREYERALDIDIALTIVPLSLSERSRLLQDEELAARIAVLDAKNRSEMVEMLRRLGRSSESDGIKLAALRELGKTYYPKRFKDAGEAGGAMPRTIRYVLVESNA
jgi:hypothetical protein